MVRPEPQPAWLHGSTPRAQTEGERGIVRAPMSSTTMRPAIGGRRILVVGAGIAGLGAARALHDLGYEVEVVEARERLGGRIWTVDRIDYGAHWIHGTEGNPITQLARMLELPTLFVGGDSTYTGGWQHIEFRSGGTAAFDEEEKRQSILAADELLERLDQWRERSSDQNGASVAEAVRAVQEANPQWSEEQRRHMAWHVELWSRDDCAAGAESLSARYWDGALGRRPRRLPLGAPRGGTHLRHGQRAAAEDHHREPAVAAANAARRAVLQSPPQRPRPQAVVGAR
jgi:phytoene dehydrogenase-like protein